MKGMIDVAIETTIQKRSASLRLNNGTDASGNVTLVNLSLGTLSVDEWTDADYEKYLKITDLLEPCLSKSIYRSEASQTVAVSHPL